MERYIKCNIADGVIAPPPAPTPIPLPAPAPALGDLLKISCSGLGLSLTSKGFLRVVEHVPFRLVYLDFDALNYLVNAQHAAAWLCQAISPTVVRLTLKLQACDVSPFTEPCLGYSAGNATIALSRAESASCRKQNERP